MHGIMRHVWATRQRVGDRGKETGKMPEAGGVAPEFELPDSTGTLRRLSGLLEPGPLVLLFYRGHW